MNIEILVEKLRILVVELEAWTPSNNDYYEYSDREISVIELANSSAADRIRSIVDEFVN